MAKGNVTRKANKVNELLTTCDNVDSIKNIANELDEVLKQFQDTHEAYQSLLKEEQDISESNVYFNTVSDLVTENKLKIDSCFEQPARQLGHECRQI